MSTEQQKERQRKYAKEYYRKNHANVKDVAERSNIILNKQERNAQAYIKNRNKILAAAKEDYYNDKEKHRLRSKAGRVKFKERYKIKGSQYMNMRYESDPVFRVTNIYRSRLYGALKAQLTTKMSRSQEICGCTWSELKEHIEKQFLPGMTWENKGQWHVDHIKPCASFDLSNQEELLKCFHYTNLQPLWATDNLSKGCKVNTDL